MAGWGISVARQRVAGPQRWDVAGGAGGGWPRRKRKWRSVASASRSDGEAELLSRIAGFGVEPYEKLSGQSDADGFLGLSGSGEGLVEFAEVGFMAADQSLDGAKGGIERLPQGVGVDALGDLRLEGADLAIEQGDEFVDALQHAGIGDGAALVGLAGAQIGDLAHARHQGFELLLGGAGRGLRDDALALGEMGDDAAANVVVL